MTTLRPLNAVLVLVCIVGFSTGAFWLGGRWFEAKNRAEDLDYEARFHFLRATLLQYHHENGAFPPTKYQPVAGGPIHSWRVLLIPSVRGRQAQYDFSQEWNSPNNLQALSRVPPGYGYFRMRASQGDVAHFLAISEDDEWPSEKPLRACLITKGEDRFLLVADPDSDIHWMEPRY